MKLSKKDIQLINFLQDKLMVSASGIALALRCRQKNWGSLPIILWQYGLVSLQQLDQIWEWQQTVELD
ncbi:MAG TPA: hypothetical protein DDZ80_00715 [Cyanobacteria bacterium UBA8803]|nr:hypothetical protein [Cyanobacteria bacterium UBA9273]HBL57132.1 hypothetical protein [Cyanobacteria bacterium UBA8803]